MLDLSIPPSKQERLFAATDINGSGRVSEEEFAQGWADMVEAIVDESVAQAGLSPASIAALVAAALLCLGLVFTFIFLALSGWHTEQSFTASVRTILVAVAGRAATSLRGRVKAEKSTTDMDEIVEQIWGSNEEQSTED